jgi:hypothetical protein
VKQADLKRKKHISSLMPVVCEKKFQTLFEFPIHYWMCASCAYLSFVCLPCCQICSLVCFALCSSVTRWKAIIYSMFLATCKQSYAKKEKKCLFSISLL